MIKVGDRRTEFCEELQQKIKCVVVYVHPQKRFYVVQYDFKFGSFCESFKIIEKEKVLNNNYLGSGRHF